MNAIYSNHTKYPGTASIYMKSTMPTTLKEFESVFPKLVDDLSEHAKEHGIPSNALKWYQDVRSLLFSYPTTP